MIEEELPTIVHKVCGLLLNGRVELDLSTLPLIEHSPFSRLGIAHIDYEVVHVFAPSPPEGFMVLFLEDGSVYQGVLDRKAIFFPRVSLPTMGIKWFASEEEAGQHIVSKLCNKNTGCCDTDFGIVVFNHKLELDLYMAARWDWIRE